MQPSFVYQPSQLDSLVDEVVATFADGAREVVLDLDSLPRLDTDGVRGLILLLRRSRESAGEIVLKVTRPEILRSLHVMALDRLFRVTGAVAA